jgi:hypothetical protein
MTFRYLRIAWSVAWGVLAVLLCMLWMRSYWWWDWYNSSTVARQNATVGSTQGWLEIVIRIGTLPDAPRPYSLSAIPVGELPAVDGHWELHAFHYPWGGGEYSIQIPHWFPAFSATMFAAAVWIRWRFSLRTLLIATMLFAVMLGLIAYAAR